MINKKYTLSIFTENSPGVLHRITTVFTRRKINIESLTVSNTEQAGISRFTIVVCVVENLIEKLVAQIRRVIEVREAFFTEDQDLLYREVSFIRVLTRGAADRKNVEEIARANGAGMFSVENESVVIEKSGTEEQIRSLYLLLEPFGISEFIQSGRIAIRK